MDAKSQEPHKLWDGMFSAQTPSEHAKCTILFSRKLMLGETSDGEFKLLRFKELDNNYELLCGVKRTLTSYEIQINVMQNIVAYQKWPNVVDIYCKRADTKNRIY